MALVDIICSKGAHATGTLVRFNVTGALVEHVVVDCPDIEFCYVGESDYLAFHHLQQTDGETLVEGTAPCRRLDLRNRLTFVPRGAKISGWSKFAKLPQGFIALSFKPELLFQESGPVAAFSNIGPALYFQDNDLVQTFAKIERVLKAPSPDALHLDSLVDLAVLELAHAVKGRGELEEPSSAGQLSARQVAIVTEYMRANLAEVITLGELAALVGLSRYHFARSFSRTVGAPPHQHLISMRIELAKELLGRRSLRVKDVARMSGFKNASDFARAFFSHTQQRPTDFKRRAGG